jgi:hypothetical protein
MGEAHAPNARHGLAACGERVARTATPGLRGARNAQRNGGPGCGSMDGQANRLNNREGGASFVTSFTMEGPTAGH